MKTQVVKKCSFVAFIVLSCVLLVSSCSSPLKRKIKKDNIKRDIEEINKEIDVTSSIQKSFLSYLEEVLAKTNDKNDFVLNLENSNLSYKQVFADLELLDSKLIPYELKRIKIIRSIDSTCNIIQETVDRQAFLRDSLNSLVVAKVFIARKTIWDFYDDVIEVKTIIKNYSGHPIHKVTFDLNFKNSNNEEFSIPCIYIGNLINKKEYSYIYDEVAHKKDFMLLNSLKLPIMNLTSYQIKSIKHANGKLESINTEYLYNDLYINVDYKSGNCPYLLSSNELNQMLKKANENYLKIVNEVAPYLNDFFVEYIEKSTRIK